MHKILYAINYRAAEDAISKHLSDEYLAVGAVTYREAVIEHLKTTGADTLLIRETLPGSTNLEGLLKRIRVEYPDVRIVVICTERPKKDPFLQTLVGLGIYDIINSDKPTITDMVSYIRTPRTFRDAAQYGIGLPEAPISRGAAQPTPPPSPEPASNDSQVGKKAKGFFSDVKRGFSALRKPPPTQPTPQPTQSTPTYTHGEGSSSVDVELLRDSIRQSEQRKAQQDLDKLINDAVNKQTAILLAENEDLKRRLERAEMDTGVAEAHASSTMEELNTLRAEKDSLAITLTDTRREMQKVIDMYEDQLKAMRDPTNTPEWYAEQSQIWETQKSNLKRELDDKKREAEELAFKCESLATQVKKDSDTITDLRDRLERAKDMQLSEAGSEELIGKLRGEASEAKGRASQLEAEMRKLQKELDIAREGGPDYSAPLEDVPLLPDDTIYKTGGTSPQTIVFIGGKHGVGTTTAAMNLAASLAGRGLKTMLVELNGNYPYCNQFFELTHIPYGVEEAIQAVAAGDLSGVDRAIIRPHGLRPTHGNLYKIYKKLPAGLHFLLFSNESLVNHSYEKNPLFTEATLYTLLNYLAKRQQYSHIILDIQCDDFRLQESLFNSGYPFDKLCVVITQDPHALATTGVLISRLSRAHASSLVAGGEFIINKFAPNAPITPKKVEQMLHIGGAQISKITEDINGYLNAVSTGLPYLVNGGHYWMEYDVLRSKICPNS